MWRKSLSLGLVMAGASWLAAIALVLLAWTFGAPYLAHLGIIFAALGGTLTLAQEHHRTRRHFYIVCAQRDPERVPEPRTEYGPTLSNVGRIRRDNDRV